MKELHVLLQRFADAGLEFVVVGGFAGVLHGSAYVTEDLDICQLVDAGTLILRGDRRSRPSPPRSPRLGRLTTPSCA